MSEQAGMGGAQQGAGGQNGSMPLPATRANFMDNMRAKNQQHAAAVRQAAAQPRQQPSAAVTGGQQTGANGAPSMRDRVSAAESQAQSDAATTGGAQPSVDGQEHPELEQAGLEQEAADPGEQKKLGDKEALDRYREWESAVEIPDAFLDKMVLVKQRNADGSKTERYVTGREMRDGYMRLHDYQRNNEAMRARGAELDQRDARVTKHFEAVNDPAKFVEEYEDMGYGEVLQQVSEIYAERRAQEVELIRAAGFAAMQKFGADQNDRRVHDAMRRTEEQLKGARATELENRRLQREAKRATTQRQSTERQEQHAQRKQALEKQLSQIRPRVLQAYGIPDNDANQQDFIRHLNSLAQDPDFDGTVDAKLCMKAAQILSEELEDRRGRREGAGKKGGQPLPPQRLAAGMNRGADGRPTAPVKQSKSPSDFAKQYFGRPR